MFRLKRLIRLFIVLSSVCFFLTGLISFAWAQQGADEIEVYIGGKKYKSLKDYKKEKSKRASEVASKEKLNKSDTLDAGELKAVLESLLKELPGAFNGSFGNIDTESLIQNFSSEETKLLEGKEKLDFEKLQAILQNLIVDQKDTTNSTDN